MHRALLLNTTGAVRLFSSSPVLSTPVFAGYRIRKPEALLEVSVRHAKFKAAGTRGNFFSATQEGSVRLVLSSAVTPATAGSIPTYDYSNKLHVDVSALDIVSIIQSQISQPVRVSGALPPQWLLLAGEGSTLVLFHCFCC